MNEALKARLATLPSLGEQKRSLVCKICKGNAMSFDVVDFSKHCSHDPYKFGFSGIPVPYYRCATCSFTFTDLIDDWADDEIQKFIYNDEYIKVDPEYNGVRAERDAQFFISILSDHRNHTVLDYGGGTGVLAKQMRKAGFNAESYDPFSSPHRPTHRFDIITCMEVLEHSPDPVRTFNDMLALLSDGGCVLLATEWQPENFDDIRANWWYAAPRNGHVSLQSVFSMVALARGAGLTSYPSDRFCGFARDPSPSIAAFLAMRSRPLQSLVLLAPEEGVSQPGLRQRASDWHDLEDRRFRWTATSDVVWEWDPEPVAGDAIFRLPTIMEIEPGFLERSRLIVDGRPAECKVGHGTLTARVTLSGNTPISIRLETPPPPVARDANGCDDLRRLGLAVLAATS